MSAESSCPRADCRPPITDNPRGNPMNDTALESPVVLVVDDDPDVRDLIEDYLSGQGYRVLCAPDAGTARGLLETHAPEVVLLDVGLPGEDGLTLARFIRERLDIGIIMVSGAGETLDRIVGLEVGADDYLAKPFDLRELKARLKGICRRYRRSAPRSANATLPAESETRRITLGRCQLDLDTRQLFDLDSGELPLTSMEFELLKMFVERPNRPLTRDQILSITQNRDWNPYDRSIDIRIARLRRKIELDPEHPALIRTVRGHGYMFVPAKSG
ncbi:response regulator [Thiocapsa roseopersicina]|uniref:Two-component system, OmpR family, phosphate regulon response regulator OmpR n=1 Tax=Thiocapsa roseopersicina TaxID=1058 RepID=A0A1H3A6Z8_THIRO|nr:response regulator [Thiocapsa roseopersicina]SDX25522.1 two-component system, OmpR family, phosphate regulon response regulator OmpR [Thiocapsa roseopersicina]